MSKKTTRTRRPVVAALLVLAPALLLVRPGYTEDISAFERGNQLLEEASYPEALSAYGTFVKENPGHRLVPAANWTIANTYLLIDEDYERAGHVFSVILIENRDTEWEFYACERLGYCYEQQSKWKEAAEVYAPVVRKLSGSARDPVALGRLNLLKRRLLSTYENLGEHDSIVLLYQEILAEDSSGPSASEDQFGQAQAYLNMNDLKKAAENYALVVERYPGSNYAERVHVEQESLLVSELAYDWSPYLLFQSGCRLGETGQYDSASSRFDNLIQSRDNSPMAAAARFQKHLIEYRRSGDAEALTQTISSDAANYPYGLGGFPFDRFNYFLGMVVEARAALESDPEDAEAYARMGLAYHQTQAYHQGIEAYKKALAIAPNSPNSHNMLGYCHLGVEAYDEAVSAFQGLIEVAPDDPNSYDSMAEGHYLKGDTLGAIRFYEKAVDTDSTFSNPYFMMGRIYQELNEREKASQLLRTYLELDPGGFWSESARTRLEELGGE